MADSPVPATQREDHFFLAMQRWLSRNEVTAVTLACHAATSLPLGVKRRPAVETPGCLQELPLYRLVDLYLAGVRDVAVHLGDCCRDSVADVEVLSSWQSRLGDLLQYSAIDAKPARTWTWSLSPTRIPVDRRGLLGLGRSEPPWPDHNAGSDEESRLIASLRAAGITTIEEPPPGLSLLASGCTACGVCVAACPHDALALFVDGSQTSLEHRPDLCRGEQQCVALCPVDALSTEGPSTWQSVLEGSPQALATLETSDCERCQTRFPAASGQRWCEPCRIRRSDPFGSHLPAAAVALMRSRGHERSQ